MHICSIDKFYQPLIYIIRLLNSRLSTPVGAAGAICVAGCVAVTVGRIITRWEARREVAGRPVVVIRSPIVSGVATVVAIADLVAVAESVTAESAVVGCSTLLESYQPSLLMVCHSLPRHDKSRIYKCILLL